MPVWTGTGKTALQRPPFPRACSISGPAHRQQVEHQWNTMALLLNPGKLEAQVPQVGGVGGGTLLAGIAGVNIAAIGLSPNGKVNFRCFICDQPIHQGLFVSLAHLLKHGRDVVIRLSAQIHITQFPRFRNGAVQVGRPANHRFLRGGIACNKRDGHLSLLQGKRALTGNDNRTSTWDVIKIRWTHSQIRRPPRWRAPAFDGHKITNTGLPHFTIKNHKRGLRAITLVYLDCPARYTLADYRVTKAGALIKYSNHGGFARGVPDLHISRQPCFAVITDLFLG